MGTGSADTGERVARAVTKRRGILRSERARHLPRPQARSRDLQAAPHSARPPGQARLSPRSESGLSRFEMLGEHILCVVRLGLASQIGVEAALTLLRPYPIDVRIGLIQ